MLGIDDCFCYSLFKRVGCMNEQPVTYLGMKHKQLGHAYRSHEGWAMRKASVAFSLLPNHDRYVQ